MGRIRKVDPVGTPLAQHIGRVLLDLRQRDQVTMRQVADGAGISATFVCDLENGHSSPSADTLWMLAKYFDVPVSRFFKGYADA